MERVVHSEHRVLIRARVVDIPGDPLKRPWTLWQSFCHEKLKRDPIYDSDSGERRDELHIPGGFDASTDIKRWFLIDVGVRGPKSPAEHLCLHYKVYRAILDEQKGSL